MTATGVLRQASWICTDNADKFMQRVNRASFSSCYSRSQELSCWNQYKFLYCSGNWWKVASLECCQLQDAWEEQEEQDALMDCLVKRCLLLCWSRGEVLQMLHFCNGVPIAWHFWIIRLCVCVSVRCHFVERFSTHAFILCNSQEKHSWWVSVRKFSIILKRGQTNTSQNHPSWHTFRW